MKFVKTPLRDVYLLEPRVFGDQRGFFLETWNRETFAAAGFDLKVTLEATVGFASRGGGGGEGAEAPPPSAEADQPRHLEITANDRRFLRSLRIAADEVKVEEAN